MRAFSRRQFFAAGFMATDGAAALAQSPTSGAVYDRETWRQN
jgi:hypothetical protein